MENNNEPAYFGLTNFRGQQRKFGIKTDDRRRHFYCIGKTGMGKSNLMENMAIQDIQAGRGVAYVDPHGEGAEKLLDYIPSERINDVIFFNPADLDYPIAFNVMEKVDFRYRHLVAGGLMAVFKKVWPDVWSARMEYILNNAILALLEYPDATLLGVNRMFADPEYRDKVIAKVTDPVVKSFWTVEYAKYSQRYEQEATAAIQNKVGQFISNPLIRNIIGQTKSSINMRNIMDEKKIFIMDLSKGRIGEDNSKLLGCLLITKFQLAAMSRVDIPEETRKDTYLYVDEFQNFATEAFASILSEARKYRLNLIVGHQYINQMEEEVRDAVFGNIGTLVVFRVGAEDAEFLEKEFTPEFTAEDLVNLPKYNVYLKLMIDGVAGHPFSAQSMPPIPPLEVSNREKIIRASRERYAVKREVVEEKISRWAGFTDEEGNEIVHEKPKANNPDKRQDRPQAPRQAQGKQDGAPQGRVQPDGTTLYDAICSNCGKSTKVIFPPEEGRKIYCKSCLKKMKEEKAGNPSAGSGQANKADKGMFGPEISIGDISFHNPKKADKNQQSQPASAKAPASTAKRGEPARQGRKEINLADLRKALEQSLEKHVEEEVELDKARDEDDDEDTADERIENR